MSRPQLWIVAGPNGSGKSTLYGQDSAFEIVGKAVWIINPDLLTARLVEAEALDLGAANLAAVQRIEAWLRASLDTHQTIGVETVLSTGKYRPWVSRAKALGYEVRLIYVLVDSAEKNVERVRLRVAKGGHAVAEEAIRRRRTRSLEQLPWFLGMADQAVLLDNSGAQPALMGVKSDGQYQLADNAFEDFKRAVRAAEAPVGKS